MEQIIIHIRDKEKAKRLIDLLSILDFVDFVEANEDDTENNSVTDRKEEDFFAVAGLWEGREINLEIIRKQAWPARGT
jgi:hypothetical protein